MKGEKEIFLLTWYIPEYIFIVRVGLSINSVIGKSADGPFGKMSHLLGHNSSQHNKCCLNFNQGFFQYSSRITEDITDFRSEKV